MSAKRNQVIWRRDLVGSWQRGRKHVFAVPMPIHMLISLQRGLTQFEARISSPAALLHLFNPQPSWCF